MENKVKIVGEKKNGWKNINMARKGTSVGFNNGMKKKNKRETKERDMNKCIRWLELRDEEVGLEAGRG